MLYTLSIDGLIGAGKSTLIQHLISMSSLKHKVNFYVIKEPINIWTNLNFQNSKLPKIDFLKLFYESQSKYAALFQIFVLATRYKVYQSCVNHIRTTESNTNSNKINILIFDRSLESTMLFTNILHEENKINNIELKIIKLLYDEYIKYIPQMNIKIFLNVKPNQALTQISKRARNGEHNITLEYLNKLYKEHQTFFKNTNYYNIEAFDIKNIHFIIKQIDNILETLLHASSTSSCSIL